MGGRELIGQSWCGGRGRERIWIGHFFKTILHCSDVEIDSISFVMN